MKTEETILNYMDGTLSEDESGELLHQLSVSPEKRVVLEQHIKLRELTSFAQKPVSVPQTLEASMAERFPAIAAYNRELAGGAMIIEQAARPNYIGRMAAAVAAFIGQYPVRTGFAVAAASVIAYFSLVGSNATNRNDASDRTTGVALTSTQEQQQITQAPVPQVTTPLKSYKSNESHNSSMSSAFSPKAKTSSYRNLTSTNIAKQSNTNLYIAENVHITTPDKLVVTPPTKVSIEKNKNVADAPASITAIPADKKNTDNSPVDNSAKNDRVNDIASITPVTDIRSQSISLSENNIHGNRTEQNPFKDHEDNYGGIPIAFRFYGSLGGSFVNVHQNDATLVSRTEGSALLGIDYIVNPYVSVGIEGGNAAISQLITQSALQSNINGLPSISRVVVSNVVTNGSQFYARAVAHYTFNPFDAIHFEGTVGAGLAFSSSSAPLVSGAVYAGHDFNEHFGISAGLAFAGAWTKANVQNLSPQITASSADPIGYVTTNHASATLFTPSYGVRVGLKYRL